MTDLSPDVQAKLRTQAGTECRCYLGTDLRSIKCEMCRRLTDAYALGISSERARQQGLIQKWRAQPAIGMERAAVERCADELEAGQ